MTPTVNKSAVLVVLLAFLAGCTVGPDYKKPPVTAPEQIHGQAEPAEAASLADRAWWEIITDASLKALIDEALRNSYDVRLAGWRVEEARAKVAARCTRAAYLATGFATICISRSRASNSS